jgi:hypothetical protein
MSSGVGDTGDDDIRELPLIVRSRSSRARTADRLARFKRGGSTGGDGTGDDPGNATAPSDDPRGGCGVTTSST